MSPQRPRETEMSDESTWSLQAGAAHRLVGGEYFVVTDDRAFHHIHVPSAVALFRQLTLGPQTTDSLVTTLLSEFDVGEAVASRDVLAFVGTLTERQLVTCAGELNPPIPGQSGGAG